MLFSCTEYPAPVPCPQPYPPHANFTTPMPYPPGIDQLTPVPYPPAGADAAVVTNGFAAVDLQIMVAFLLYLTFFGWVGRHLGAARGLIIFVVSLLTWLALQIRGGLIVTMSNLAGKLLQSILSGDFGNADLSAIANQPDLITDANRDAFLFFAWTIIVIMAYALSPRIAQNIRFGNPGWAILLGIGNGLLFAAILLPLLLALVLPDSQVPGGYVLSGVAEANVIDVVSSGFAILIRGISRIWQIVRPQAALVLLLVITLLLALATGTLRRGGGRSSGRANGTNSNRPVSGGQP